MRSRPRVLLITNEATPGDAAGQVDGYKVLEVTGELGRVDAVSAQAGFKHQPEAAVERVVQAIYATRPDIAVIWSPRQFPGSRAHFERIQRALGAAHLVYWEGDAWHKAKASTEQMGWWMQSADIVFSTAGPPQATDFLKAGARAVQHVANTYCHLKFHSCEAAEPPPIQSLRVTMIGSNLMRIPGITGLPGSFRRAELAVRLSRAMDDFELRGTGWGWVGLKAKPIAYVRQADLIRSGACSVIWDHLPNLPDYSSDRMPIALIAGRPLITTRHPGMHWGPNEDQGLFQRDSPSQMVNLITELLLDASRMTALGREAHRWAAHRVSHREAARFIIAQVVDSVAPPPDEPWGHLPSPWTTAPQRAEFDMQSRLSRASDKTEAQDSEG